MRSSVLQNRSLVKDRSTLRHSICRSVRLYEVGGHGFFLMALPVLQNSDRGDGQESGSHNSPTKNGPTQPADSGTGRSEHCDGFSRGQSERDYISTIAAAREVLDHEGALSAIKRMLGERGEKISVRMRFRDCWLRSLQLMAHDFWNVLHLQLFGFSS
jgi:hypothetical protein